MSLPLIYAPNCHLIINYCTEYIYLHKDGSAEFIYDVLVTNDSHTDIDNIIICYPYLLNNERRNKRDVSLPEFEDITPTLYAANNNKLNWNRPHDAEELNLDSNVYSISFPDLSDMSKSITLSGAVGDSSLNRYIDVESTALQHILSIVKYSFLEAKCLTPIKGKESKWFRWRIKNIDLQPLMRSTINKFLHRFKKSVTYDYEIVGPGNILDAIANRLLSYQYVLNKYSPDKDPEFQESVSKEDIIRYQKILKNITRDFFQDHGIKDSTTTSVDYLFCKIYVIPGKLSRLYDMEKEGEVRTIGRPSFYEIDHKTTPVYGWIIGNELTLKSNTAIKFKIYFTTQAEYNYGKYFTWLYKLIKKLFVQ